MRAALADHPDRTAVRLDQAEAAAQRRRLAGAVRAQQSEAFAPPDLERQPAHHFLRTVALAQAFDAQHRIGERDRPARSQTFVAKRSLHRDRASRS
jgi:hypothetical protein